LVRVDPATGRVILVPGEAPISDSSPTSFVSSAGHTQISSTQPALGVLIPDAGPAGTAPGLLATVPVVLPGPDPAHLWVWDGFRSGDPRVLLVDWRGRQTGDYLASAAYLAPYSPPQPDGAGYALFSGIGGVYDVRPDVVRLVTHGLVLAAGPTGYLAYECGDTPRCRMVAIDGRTGARRNLPDSRSTAGFHLSTVGQITADGRHAAWVAVTESNGVVTTRIHLLDLLGGTESELALSLDPDAATAPTFGFTPDGGGLVVAMEFGRLALVDVATGAIAVLPRSIPRVDVLTVRPSG
jgi:hypothetical protein